MLERFETVCETMAEAKRIERDCEKVLKVLRENGGLMRMKDISAVIYPRLSEFYNLTSYLKMLQKLGLVERVVSEEYETITIETNWAHWDYVKEDYIVVDGERFIREGAEQQRTYEMEKEVPIVYFKAINF